MLHRAIWRASHWFIRHVHSHPWRLAVTLVLLLALSFGLLGWSFYHASTIQHRGRVENCRGIDEINRKLRVAFADVGYPVISARFRPTMRCEEVP